MPSQKLPTDVVWNVAVIGAGAAGLATAIFAARGNSDLRIVALDGAKKLGAKILVSGGGRCNVTNVRVEDTDFFGGNRNVVRRILNTLTVSQTISFFKEIGVDLHEEAFGKLFPDSNSARTVLNALVGEARRLGVDLRTDCRVSGITRAHEAFEILLDNDRIVRARQVVLATGGRSLPKTGSDGQGYELAKSLGHALTPTTPALAPLVLDGDFHTPLSGIAQEVELTLRCTGEKPTRISGPMLWTHFGISGPAALDLSRHWHRTRLEKRAPLVTANLLPKRTLEQINNELIALAAHQGRTRISSWLSEYMPARVAESISRRAGISADQTASQLNRDHRWRFVESLTALRLEIRDSRGYAYAEVTAGGVPLAEIDAATMQSRICPGLYFVGEILDVDGRLGGFNFQWAWCTAAQAGRAIAGDAGPLR